MSDQYPMPEREYTYEEDMEVAARSITVGDILRDMNDAKVGRVSLGRSKVSVYNDGNFRVGYFEKDERIRVARPVPTEESLAAENRASMNNFILRKFETCQREFDAAKAKVAELEPASGYFVASALSYPVLYLVKAQAKCALWFNVRDRFDRSGETGQSTYADHVEAMVAARMFFRDELLNNCSDAFNRSTNVLLNLFEDAFEGQVRRFLEETQGFDDA